jgi:hypothetical protein
MNFILLAAGAVPLILSASAYLAYDWRIRIKAAKSEKASEISKGLLSCAFPRPLRNSKYSGFNIEQMSIRDSGDIVGNLIQKHFYKGGKNDSAMKEKYPLFYSLAEKGIEKIAKETIMEEKMKSLPITSIAWLILAVILFASGFILD